jgi:Uma2 family endonuclease
LKQTSRQLPICSSNWAESPPSASSCTPRESIPQIVPNLAVEVLGYWNTRSEMNRKVNEYFNCGVPFVWIVDHESRTINVHDARREPIVLDADGTLDGGSVLPGFTLPVAELFAELDEVFS